jgi:hypothetical protein
MNVPVEFIVLAITGWVGVLTWIFKSKASSYDQHLRECGERRVADGKTDATVEQRIKSIERNSNQTETAVGWLGDCMIMLGARLGVDLPERPKS